jgi:hypothetical protein
LGYRWTAPLHAFKLSPLYTLLDLFSTKPPIWKCYKMYEEDPNLMFLAEFDKLEEHERLKREGVKGAIYSTS